MTTFTIKANYWTPSATFDGQSITYTRTQTDHVPASPAVAFPEATGSNSPWLTNTIYPQGVAIIFGKIVGDPPDQIWQWLAPSVSGSDLTFTVSDTAGDDTTKVYVFTIGTNHGQSVAYSPFAITRFGTGGGSVTRTSIIYYGPYKAGTVQWGEYLKDGMLPKITKQIFVYDPSNTDVSPDNNPFIPEVSTQSLNVTILSSRNNNINNELSASDTVIIFMIDQNSLILSVRSSTIFNVYNISTGGYNTTTLNSYVSYKADMSITNTGSSTITVNDFNTTNPSPKITGTVIYNRAINAIGSLPIPHVSSLQMVTTNLQTIYDRLGGVMVEAQGYGTTRQYFAVGDFADRIWERFDTTINRLIINGAIGTNTAAIADQLDTIFRAYIITVPSDSSDAKAITGLINTKTYSLYIEHEGTYHAVMSSQNGITVNGVSDGSTWDTLTGGDIVINRRLFYNNVSQPIVTDWTTDELNEIDSVIDTKTIVLVDGKKYPLITFKNISPSLIWINESDGLE